MSCKLSLVGSNKPDRPWTHRSIDCIGHGNLVFGFQKKATLPASGQFDINIGQKLAVEQRVVTGPFGQVDGEAAAKGIEAVGQAREPGFS